MGCPHRYTYISDGNSRCMKCGQIASHSSHTKSSRRTPRSRKSLLAILLAIPIIAVAMLWITNNEAVIDDLGDGILDASKSLDGIIEDVPEIVSDSIDDAADVPETVFESLDDAVTVLPMPQDLSDIPDAVSDTIPDIPDVSPILQLDSPSKPTTEPINDARERMLSMINAERQKVGLNTIVMGSNQAAQIHAENMLSGCFSSHWGLDGLTPNMRYSLAGGTQYNAENVSGLSYCVGSNYVTIDPVTQVHETMNGFMSSPGHRDNILDPHHTTVNIGIAADSHNMMVAQQFEYGYADFETIPAINGDTLSFALDIKNLIKYTENYDISVSMHYDPPPHDLTQGQVASTYCYGSGATIAFFAPPLEDGYHYTDNESVISGTGCPNPYDISPDTPAPASPENTLLLHDVAKATNVPHTYTVPFVTATEWALSRNHFEFAADIQDIKRGPGVYTVTVFVHDNKDTYTPITTYSIFHETPHPIGYS